MRVYLTGFMASGKSTVGPAVAARLGHTFVDLDRLIVAHDGRSIPEIFAADGEGTFRRLETEALHKTAGVDEVVVALGGGALVDDENRSFAKRHGRVVYLRVGAETVLERVADEADERPLLQTEDGTPLPQGEMKARIQQMLDRREASYTAAHDTVDATRPIDDVVDAVLERVRAANGSTSGKG